MVKQKIILLDFPIFSHRAGYATKNNPKIPASYTCFNMILSCLNRIGVNKEDDIIVAQDGKGSWRKELLESYKGQRQGQRKKSGLDWKSLFREFNWLLRVIDEATDWTVCIPPKIEADDLASYIVRHNLDKECILVSYDKDWMQLLYYNNVKIFSPHPKKKTYKIKPKNFNAYEFLAKSIYEEKKENLVGGVQGIDEFELREILKNIITLPDYVDKMIEGYLGDILSKSKELNIEKIPFPAIRKRFHKIYSKEKVITYEEVEEKEMKKRR